MDISPPIQSGSNGPIAKECHRFLVAGPFNFQRSALNSFVTDIEASSLVMIVGV